MEMQKKTLEDYKRLPYTLRVEPVYNDEGGAYWTAEYTELRGCKTDGPTDVEAVANLQELFDEYISMKIESNDDIPEPILMPMAAPELIVLRKEKTFKRTLFPSAKNTDETKGAVNESKIFEHENLVEA